MATTNRLLLTSVAILACSLMGASTPPSSPGRVVAAVLDVTPSYKAMQEARGKLIDVVYALGPGDTFILVVLGGRFDPRDSVVVQARLEGLPPKALAPVSTENERRTRQAILNAAWLKADGARQRMKAFLSEPSTPRDGTPLFEVLRYLSERLSKEQAASLHLLLFTDLIQDAGGLKSTKPPAGILPFRHVHVSALYMPWRGDWKLRNSEWHKWFCVQGGALSFEAMDEAESRSALLIPASLIPRRAQLVGARDGLR